MTEFLHPQGFSREKDLLAHKLVPFSKATLWRKVKTGQFPSPVRVCGVTAWRNADIIAWAASLGVNAQSGAASQVCIGQCEDELRPASQQNASERARRGPGWVQRKGKGPQRQTLVGQSDDAGSSRQHATVALLEQFATGE